MKKRVLCLVLCLSILLGVFSVSAVAGTAAAASGEEVTDNIASMLTNVELVGAEKADDGSYHVLAGQPYSIKLTFQENENAQMDMSDHIRYELPLGVITGDMLCLAEIGVYDEEGYTSIIHNCAIVGNVVTITWNKEDIAFADLSRAPSVYFDFYIQGIFDGSAEEVRFEDGSRFIVNMDSLGIITVNKTLTGLKPDVTLTDAQKREMTFELRSASGQVVRSFTYADMEEGSVTFEGMLPGDYAVVETGYPVLSDYTYDTSDSVVTAAGTLPEGGVLTLSLSNDYDLGKGNLELYKTILCTNWDHSATVPVEIINGISFTITGPYGYRKKVLYSAFVNGKYTVSDLDAGTYTVSETNEVTGYTCTYKVNGVAADTPDAAVAVAKGATASVSFENIYTQKTASLTVRKTASGAAVPANTEFTVTFPDGTTERSFRYSDMIDGKYTLSDVPLGTYRVTENKDSAQVSEYILIVTGEGDVILSEDQTKEIHNEYARGGKLKVNKSILGDLSSDVLTDLQKKTMKFTVTNAAGTAVGVLTYADVLEGKTLLLPAGTYTVKESGAAIQGYSLETVPASGSVSVSVSAGETAQASFTNTYTQYSLTLVKRFAADSEYGPDELPDWILDYTVVGVADSSTYEVFWMGSLRELMNMPEGLTVKGHANCMVAEINEWAEGYPFINCTVRMSVDGGNTYSVHNDLMAGLIDQWEITEPKDITVILENSYSGIGIVYLDKTVKGLSAYEESQLRDRITFSVYREDNGVFSLYKENVSLLEGAVVLSSGNYYIQETGALGVNGYTGPAVQTQTEGYHFDMVVTSSASSEYPVVEQQLVPLGSSALKEGSNTDIFTVSVGDIIAAHFTNTYTIGSGAGRVELTKYVRGLDEIGSSDEVELTNELEVENTEGQLLYDGIQFKLEILVDGVWHDYNTYSLSGFADGISLLPGHYRMTELNGNVEGYVLHTDYLFMSELGGGSEQTSEGTVEFDITESQALELEAHNVYTKIGNLKITKTTAGVVTGSALGVQEQKKILFTVTGPFGFEETFSYYDIFSAGAKVLSNIPVGEYTITETAGDTSNFLLTVSSNLTGDNAPKSGTVTVRAGETVQVDFINTYAYKTGTLVIQKTFDGDVPATLTEEQKKAMVFQVFRAGSGASATEAVYEVTYDQFTDGFYTIPNVPVGSYRVLESIGVVLANEYIVETAGNNNTVSVTNGGTATAAVKNTFTKKGSLKLVKVFDGAPLSQEEKGKVLFTYWMIGENGTKLGETTVSYNDFTDGCYIANGMLPGEYTVREENGITGYYCTSSVKVNDGTAVTGTSTGMQIASGTCTTVTFTNTYAGNASLQILKVNEGALTQLSGDQAKAIVFTIYDSEGKLFATRDWSYLAGRGFGGMAPGEYTVMETINDPTGTVFGDYTISTKYRFGQAVAENGRVAHITLVPGKNILTFTNTYTKNERLGAELSSSKTYVGMAEIDGARYPVWQFKLAVSNLVPQTTEEGVAVFSDVFDTTREANLFRLATKAEVSEALGYEEQNAYLTSLVEGKEAPTATFDEVSSAIVIRNVTDDTADKCVYTYYLIVRDREALRTINAALPEGSSGVHYDFLSTVTYRPIPYTDETEDTGAAYEYGFAALRKDISNVDEQGILYQIIGGRKVQVNYADYSITLNEDGLTLGNESTIVVTDIFSPNQTVLPSSITVNPSDGVSFALNNEEHRITFTIPNGTPVTVSYRANVNNSQGAIRLTNSISYLGFYGAVDREIEGYLGGEGHGEVYSVRIRKVDSQDSSKALEGVIFALYDGKTDVRLTEATTDSSGLVQFKYWGTAGALKPDYNYYIKEESAADGYHRSSDTVRFRITDSEPGTDGDVLLLTNGGILVVTNEPVAASLEVTKIFNDWSKQREFSFVLEAQEGAPMPAAGGEIAVATEAAPTASFGRIYFPVSEGDFSGDKVVTYRYTIREVIGQVAGVSYDTTVYPVTVVISDHDSNGVREISVTYGTDNKESLTVTNHYGEGTLIVSKTLNGNDVDPAKEFTFTVRLNPALNGTYSGVVFTNGLATIVLKGGESKTIEGLPGGTEYTVTEADYSGDGYQLTARSGDSGTIAEGTVSVASFTNTKNTTAPDTGDNRNPSLWITLLFSSAIGIVGTVIYSKKKKDSTDES